MEICRAVFLPTALYGSELWHTELETNKCRDKLNRAQRVYFLAITRLYGITGNRKIFKLLNTISLELKVYREQIQVNTPLKKNNEFEDGERSDLEGSDVGGERKSVRRQAEDRNGRFMRSFWTDARWCGESRCVR